MNTDNNDVLVSGANEWTVHMVYYSPEGSCQQGMLLIVADKPSMGSEEVKEAGQHHSHQRYPTTSTHKMGTDNKNVLVSGVSEWTAYVWCITH